jgi:hypothetical protein
VEQSIFYVDIENLQDIAKQTLISAIENWPAEFPKPSTLKLYAKADQTEMWRIWTSHHFPSIEVLIKGVQHYTYNGSKNSADISLALDALADVLKKRTKHIAIMSDDSDYTSLFSMIKQEIDLWQNSNIPFKWFMTDRLDTRSTVLKDFLPVHYVHVVNISNNLIIEKENKKTSFNEDAFTEEEKIARLIIQNTPIGYFKSSDCKKYLQQYFPKHNLNKSDSASFGTQFLKVIWPYLEKYGVKSEKSSRGPRKYEMTSEAKKIK